MDPIAPKVLRLQTLTSEGLPVQDFTGFLVSCTESNRLFLVTALHCFTIADYYYCRDRNHSDWHLRFPTILKSMDSNFQIPLYSGGTPNFYWHKDPDNASLDIAVVEVSHNGDTTGINVDCETTNYRLVSGRANRTTGTPTMTYAFPRGHSFAKGIPYVYSGNLAIDYVTNSYFFAVHTTTHNGASGAPVFTRHDRDGKTEIEWIGMNVATLGAGVGWEHSDLARCMPREKIMEVVSHALSLPTLIVNGPTSD